MSTISNERLESLQRQFMEEGFNDIRDSEVMQLVEENLALRKEREKAVTVAYPAPQDASPGWKIDPEFINKVQESIGYDEECECCEGTPSMEMVEAVLLAASKLKAPPAPVADDSLPFDPQIAEYEQMMEAEQAQADTASQQFESLAGKAVVPEGWKLVPVELTKEMRGKIHPFAEALCHGCGREVVADCEDNVTASWNDMLAVAPTPVGKQSSTAEGNNDGFECTPVADLYELLTKCGECYDYTTSAKVAADWIKEGYSAREYVKLDRLQEAMTQGSSGEADGWIPCSERMPDDGVSVLAYCKCGDNFSGIYTMRAPVIRSKNSRKDDSVVHHERVTHWMPLPAAPGKEG